MAKAYQTPSALGTSKAAIEEYAERLSIKHELTAFAENDNDPLLNFVAALGGSVNYEDPDDIVRHEDGSIVVHEPCHFDIYLSRFTGLLRDRFTVAHELGHYFLHSAQGETPLKATRKGTGPHEWEANWFAASLLMPKEQVIEFCDQNGPNTSLVASRFRVSPMAAEYRLKNLGLLAK